MKKLFLFVFLFSQVVFSHNQTSESIVTGVSELKVDVLMPDWVTQPGSLDATIECNDPASLMAAQSLSPIANNACNAVPIVLVKTSGNFIPGFCGSSGMFINSWIATDDCGNTSAPFIQVITIQDITAPVWTTPSGSLDATIDSTDAAGLMAVQSFSPDAIDSCSGTAVIKTSGSLIADGSCTGSGMYMNTWTATDACGNISIFTQVILVNCTLSNTPFQENKVAVYPNPTHSVVNLKFTDNTAIDKIIITDLSGKKLLEETQQLTQLNVESLAVGTYFLQAYSSGRKLTGKFVKE